MYTTLSDFIADIHKAQALLELTSKLKEFASYNSTNEITENNEFITRLHDLNSLSRDNHPNLIILNATMMLFIGGRFESFVRETFEELCKNIIANADKYKHLPREMKDNLTKYTAEVISNPRKYGHGDKGVKQFAKILSSNLNDDVPLTEINHICLSITTENMRPAIVSELFKRVGINELWEKMSQQSKLQVLLKSNKADQVRNEAMKNLNEFMDKRNSIAHPSSSITWPDVTYIRNILQYFEVIATVLIDSLEALEFEIQSKIASSKLSA